MSVYFNNPVTKPPTKQEKKNQILSLLRLGTMSTQDINSEFERSDIKILHELCDAGHITKQKIFPNPNRKKFYYLWGLK